MPKSYTAFSNRTAVAIIGYTGDAMEPFISKDPPWPQFNSRRQFEASSWRTRRRSRDSR